MANTFEQLKADFRKAKSAKEKAVVQEKIAQHAVYLAEQVKVQETELNAIKAFYRTESRGQLRWKREFGQYKVAASVPVGRSINWKSVALSLAAKVYPQLRQYREFLRGIGKAYPKQLGTARVTISKVAGAEPVKLDNAA